MTQLQIMNIAMLSAQGLSKHQIARTLNIPADQVAEIQESQFGKHLTSAVLQEMVFELGRILARKTANQLYQHIIEPNTQVDAEE